MFEWYKWFSGERDNVKADKSAQRPRSAIADQNIAKIRDVSGVPLTLVARQLPCSRRRRIDEAGISTPVAVDQSASNCQEEAVRSFTAMWSRCRSSCAGVTFLRLLPVLRFVRRSPVQCFQTCITVELFRCTRAQLRDMKILFLER
ncbi:uncharacterized protein TNCV_3333821 [Trichonephila clavipes]|nr:uncharacterized protein TNCV_3333821 [Trichonephila clavipes]